MQEALKKIKEEEERLAAEEAEKLKKEEEAERARQEQVSLIIYFSFFARKCFTMLWVKGTSYPLVQDKNFPKESC